MANVIKYRENSTDSWKSIPALKGDDGNTPVKGVDYFTEAEVAQIEQNAASKVNLAGYATKDYVDGKVDGKAESTHSHNISEISGYSAPDLSGYALRTQIPTVPTKVSAFTNDSGYLTEHQSLSGYARKTYVDSEIAKVPKYNLDGYATKKYVDDSIDAIEEYDLTPYAKTTYVNTALSGKANSSHKHSASDITGLQIPNMDNYALKSEIPSVPSNVSAFNNDSGYLTQHQNLSNYATKQYVEGEIAKVPQYNLSGYATKKYVDDSIDAIPDYDLTAYATKAYVRGEIAKVQPDEVDLSIYAKTSYVNNALNGKAEANHTHSQYLTQHQSLDSYVRIEDIPDITGIPTKVSELTNDAGYLTEHQSLSEYAKKSEIPAVPTVPTKVSAFTNDAGYLTQHQSLSEYAKKTDIPTVPDVSGFQTESQVNALITAALNNIGVAEGGVY